MQGEDWPCHSTGQADTNTHTHTHAVVRYTEFLSFFSWISMTGWDFCLLFVCLVLRWPKLSKSDLDELKFN